MRRPMLLTAFVLAATWTASAAADDPALRLVSRPDLSPDGKRVVFAWRGDIWIASSVGGDARPLTRHSADDSAPKFSPDGREVAFNSTRDGGRQVYVVSVDGGRPERLTYHSEGSALQGWYPDGQHLLVLGARDHFWRRSGRFFKIPRKARGGEELLFDAYGAEGQVSSDGGRLLFTREGERWWRKGYHGPRASQVWLFDSGQGGGFQKVAGDDKGSRFPLWHPSGKSIYYVSGQSGAFNLFSLELDNGKRSQLTNFDDDSVVFPCIARDGSVIVFRHLFDLYRLEPGSGKPPRRLDFTTRADLDESPLERRVLNRASDVAFTDDGLEMAFIAGGDVWVMDSELREPVQVTSGAEEERSPVFSPDGSSLLFVSDREGRTDIWRASRADEEAYWWRNTRFKLEALTADEAAESDPRFSPDGEQVSFIRGRGDLWLMKPDGKKARRILESWNRPGYDWSPDSRWIVYARDDNDFNRDVWIMPLDGSRPAFNLSRHPDSDGAPTWSPDGKLIAFTGRRFDTERDIYYVWLQDKDADKSARRRRLEKALKTMEKGRKKAKGDKGKKAEPEKKAEDKKDNENSAPAPVDKKEGKKEAKKDDAPRVVIDFAGIHERINRISIPDATEGNLVWSPDSKTLAFSARINGQGGTYTVEIPGRLRPKLLSSQTGSSARWLAKTKGLVWLSGGQPGALSASGKAKPYPFSVRQQVVASAKQAAVFDQTWRAMRDNFYDERMNNRNWDAIRRKYRPMAEGAADMDQVASVVQMMLGELNASHLGFRVNRRGGGSQGWRPVTAHLGLRFEPAYKGPGLKVRDVVPEGPTSLAGCEVFAGEVVLAIDGQGVDPGADLTAVLDGDLARDIALRVKDLKGGERKVVVRPISYGRARALLYEAWVKRCRAAVDEASKGALGYLHIRGMNWPSFQRFEAELYAVAAGKSGLVIDVRENGGGFTTDHLLTVLTQPEHAITVPRGGGQGYPQGRRVYATWSKPIIVLCNQNSFSNAEIFSHAIKILGRGKLVGVQTAGGVISTGGTTIMDVGFLRLPFRGWYTNNDGEDMELHGAMPHHVLWPRPGDWPAGVDTQLDKAIAVLLEDVEAWKRRPRPKLRKASER